MKFYGIAENGVVLEVNLSGNSEAYLAELVLNIWPQVGLNRIGLYEINQEVGHIMYFHNLITEHQILEARSELSLFAMENLQRSIAIHSAAMRFGSRFILFPGKSGTGKSQLMWAATKLSRDFDIEVLTDEYVMIELDTLEASNYIRPIQLRDSLGNKYSQLYTLVRKEFKVSHIIFSEYKSVTVNSQNEINEIVALDKANVAKGIINNVIQAKRSPHDTFSVSSALADQVKGYRVKRGEANEFLEALMKFLAK